MKAGSTYLPLDPSLPASRTSFMIEQSRCALIIGPNELESLSLFQANSKGATQFMPIEAALRDDGQTSSVVPSSNEDGHDLTSALILSAAAPCCWTLERSAAMAPSSFSTFSLAAASFAVAFEISLTCFAYSSALVVTKWRRIASQAFF
ncbi:hypothetical protein [Bradyrhizobium japonicum]|uniref:hypothetical protein n=1 Tax=Bradyrhizobium japonicum TaxID=375 RepID=UPI003B6817C3